MSKNSPTRGKRGSYQSASKHANQQLSIGPRGKGLWCYPSQLMLDASQTCKDKDQDIMSDRTKLNAERVYSDFYNQHHKSLPKLKPCCPNFIKLASLCIPYNQSTQFSNGKSNCLNIFQLKTPSVQSAKGSEEKKGRAEEKKGRAEEEKGRAEEEKRKGGMGSRMYERSQIQALRPPPIQKRSKTQMREEQKNKNELVRQSSHTNFRVIADLRRQTEIQKQFRLLKAQKMILVSSPQLRYPELIVNPFKPPTLPPTPDSRSSVQEYIKLAHKISCAFRLQFNEYDVVIRRYRNCITFQASGQTIIWNFDGKLYVGGWREIKKEEGEGLKEGKGFQKNADYCYLGDYLNGLKEGKGTILHENGNIYEGEWREGKMHGQGTFYEKKSHFYYSGQWEANRLVGKGKVKYSKRHYYEGDFVNSKKQGHGLEVFEDGSIYEGQFRAGCAEGRGRCFYPNGDIYIGAFNKSRRSGVGILYNSGQQPGKYVSCFYYGQFFDNKKNGYGNELLPDGSTYQGYYYKDEKHGPGFLVSPTHFALHGTWKGGLPEQIDRRIKDF